MAGSSRGSQELAACFSRLEHGLREIALEIVEGIFTAELARIEAELAHVEAAVAPRQRREQMPRLSSAGPPNARRGRAPAGRPSLSAEHVVARDQTPLASIMTAADSTRRTRPKRSRASGPSVVGSLSVSATAGLSADTVASDTAPVVASAEAATPEATREVTAMAAPSPADAFAPLSTSAAAAEPAGAPAQVIGDDREPATTEKGEGIDETGTVKWFSPEKAYGFIAGDDGTDVFVHQSAIVAGGLRSLRPGQRVRYEERRRPKGPSAAIG